MQDEEPDGLVAREEIAITCDAGNVKINGADPGSGAALCADITSISVTGGSGDNSINRWPVLMSAPSAS